MRSVFEAPVSFARTWLVSATVGAVPVTVKLKAGEALLTLPARSVAVAVKVYLPAASVPVSTVQVPFAATIGVRVPVFPAASFHDTTTALFVSALPLTCNVLSGVLVTTVPLSSLTVRVGALGATLSKTPLNVDVAVLPALSVATAVSV
ncbi:hypothetical protein LDDCCGHA_5345 [Methylobacterium oxalidis]|nr:hypothetical protein LDDCCGHA_5345 [Methylobacterium oxalidis]